MQPDSNFYSVKRALEEGRVFLVFFIAYIIIATFLLLLYRKADLHLLINSYHSPYFDLLFRYITHMGDGLFAVGVALLLVLFRVRYAIFVAVGYLASGIVVQLAKRLLFTGADRPARYFDGIAELHLVEGVAIRYATSFPSGHTATAFALFFCVGLMGKRRWVQVVAFVAALLVGFSRVYLSQHFLADVVGGSIIGVLGCLVVYPVILGSHAAWMDKGLLSVMLKRKGQ